MMLAFNLFLSVISLVPGYPLDVPGPLQQVLQYRVAAEHHRHGCAPPDHPDSTHEMNLRIIIN